MGAGGLSVSHAVTRLRKNMDTLDVCGAYLLRTIVNDDLYTHTQTHLNYCIFRCFCHRLDYKFNCLVVAHIRITRDQHTRIV